MHKTVHDDVIYPEKEVPVDKPVAPMVLFPNFFLVTKHELGGITDTFMALAAGHIGGSGPGPPLVPAWKWRYPTA